MDKTDCNKIRMIILRDLVSGTIVRPGGSSDPSPGHNRKLKNSRYADERSNPQGSCTEKPEFNSVHSGQKRREGRAQHTGEGVRSLWSEVDAGTDWDGQVEGIPQPVKDLRHWDRELESDLGSEQAFSVASWNAGSRGIRGSVRELAEWTQEDGPAFLLIQEARMCYENISAVRYTLQLLLPQYTAYFHTWNPWGAPSEEKDTAVITLVRKELSKWIKPLDVKGKALSGRVIALHYDPDERGEGFIVVNGWMPHSGYSPQVIQGAHKSLENLISSWQRKQPTLVMGDFNATMTPDQRTGAEKTAGRIMVADRALREWIARQKMSEQAEDPREMTWASLMTKGVEGRLDHAFASRDLKTVRVLTKDPLVGLSDHKMIVAHLHSDHGTWLRRRTRLVPLPPRLDVTDWEEKESILQARMEGERGSMGQECTLEEVEGMMWRVGEEVLGVGSQGAGRKSKLHRDKASIRLKKEISSLKRLRGIFQAGRKDVEPENTLSNDPEVHALLEAWQTEGNVQQAQDRVDHILTGKRRAIKKVLETRRRMDLRNLISRKRGRLKTGKGAIKAAMGKAGCRVEMVELETKHPDTVCMSKEPTADQRATITDLDPAGAWGAEGSHWSFRTSSLSKVYEVLLFLEAQGTEGHRILSSGAKASKADDILSAIEYHMANEGRAKENICSACLKNDLQALSSVGSNGRTIRTYCNTCNRTCETSKDREAYKDKPWPEGCFSQHRGIPQDTKHRLNYALTLQELKKTIQRMRRRKAPGKNGVPSELWKCAPDWALNILLTTINGILQGGKMPQEWRGGVVQLLFKKPPSVKLTSWRPVCMAETSYRIFSTVIACRLQKMAEAHGILEHTQEGFRSSRSTRRQIERLCCILRESKMVGIPVVGVFLDFCNAFNSIL